MSRQAPQDLQDPQERRRPDVAARASLTRVALAATVLTAAMALPVMVAPAERIFGHEIVGRHHDPFTVMRQFAGAPVPPPYLQPATDWLGRAFAWAMPPVAAYNLVVLLTFPLAALFASLLAFEITRSALAATIAGLAFAFSPFHVAHAAYHPHIAQVQWVALFLLALWRCLHGFTWRRAMGLVVAIALVTLSNFYAGLIAAALVPALLPLFWLSPAPAGGLRARRDLVLTTALLAIVAATALVAALAVLPGLAGRMPAVAREELTLYSARWWAHLVPPVDHAVLGGMARSMWARHGVGDALLEQQVYLGVGLMALAGAAIVAWLRGRRHGGAAAVPALAGVAVIALACALAPEREIAGWRVMSPSALLYELAPMFRAYARFSVVVQLMVAILAGIGAHQLWHARRGGARALVAVLLAATVFEYAPWPWRWRDVLPTTAHRWLADLPRGDVRVFDCSPPTAADGDAAWLTGVPITHGAPWQPQCDEPALAARMRAEGVTHVLVRSGEPGWDVLSTHPPDGLRVDYRGDDGAVLGMPPGRPAPFIDAFAGWYPREREDGRSWRWSSGRSTLIAKNSAATSRSTAIVLELFSFGGPRLVTASIDGRIVAELRVDVIPGRFAVGPVLLASGTTDIVLESREPALSPRGVHPGSADTRPLAFALGRWMLQAPPP